MATIQSGGSPGTRIEAGDKVIAAAKTVSTKPVAKRFAAFKKSHAAYKAAENKVQKAAAALRNQQAKVGQLDVGQDEAVMGLAVELPGDGFPRINPFKPFGAPPPAVLCGLGYAEEAQKVTALEKAVVTNKRTGAGSRKAAKKAGKVAKLVLSALKSIPKLTAARSAAMSARDALEQGWETAFAGLKRAALAAEDDGAKGLYAALFDRAPKVTAKAKAKAKAKKEAAKKQAQPQPQPEPKPA